MNAQLVCVICVKGTRMTFKRDLALGISIEKQYLEKLQKKYPLATLVNADKRWDIFVPELDVGVEIKYIPQSTAYGNVVIEIEMYNKPSGLMSTEAAYWVFYDDKEWVTITPEKIKECITYLDLKPKEFIGKGDTVKKKAFLVDKKSLLSYRE